MISKQGDNFYHSPLETKSTNARFFWCAINHVQSWWLLYYLRRPGARAASPKFRSRGSILRVSEKQPRHLSSVANKMLQPLELAETIVTCIHHETLAILVPMADLPRASALSIPKSEHPRKTTARVPHLTSWPGSLPRGSLTA